MKIWRAGVRDTGRLVKIEAAIQNMVCEGTKEGRAMGNTTITTEGAPEPRGPYPHVRIDGDRVWVTGQIGRDPATGDFVEGGFEAEFNQAITNLERILAEAGSSLSEVVKTYVQFVDEDDLDAMNRIYGERFPEPFPSRTSFGAAFLWKGAKVQIDAVGRRIGHE